MQISTGILDYQIVQNVIPAIDDYRIFSLIGEGLYPNPTISIVYSLKRLFVT